MQLLGAWTRLAQGHLSLGAGCVCGAGVGVVQAGEYEAQILDFLVGRHAADSVFGRWLRETGGYRADGGAGLADLLRALARDRTLADPAAASRWLDDLAQSLESFDALHGRG